MIHRPRVKHNYQSRVLVWVLRLGLVLLALLVVYVHYRMFKTIEASRQSTEATLGTLSTVNAASSHEQIEARRIKPVHFIYTVGCGGSSDHEWQLIQSIALDSSFRAVGQRGKLTRLVSGCENDEELKEYMSQSILPNLNVVFLPKRDQVLVPGEKKPRVYVQANRPYALKEFFQLPQIASEDPATVYTVLDPDFIFRHTMPEEAIEAVGPKLFVTQHYHLASPSAYAHQACLEAFNSTAKCAMFASSNSPLSFADWYGGVPYMLTREDWMSLLEHWNPLLGPVLLRYPGIESDMISWAIAASMSQLKGVLRKDFMATCMSAENADVEKVLEKQVFFHLCQSYYVPETRPYEEYKVNKVEKLPHIVGHKSWLNRAPYVFVLNKHWLKRSHLLESCSVPLLLGPPPPETALSYVNNPFYKWHLFIIHGALAAYNRAVKEYRDLVAHCPEDAYNASTALILHEKHEGTLSHAVPSYP